MASWSKGERRNVHVSTAALITQLSSLTHDPVGSSPSLHRLYVSCHCHPPLSSPGQGPATQKAKSVIKTKGHWGQAGARELRLCPAEDDPTSDVSYWLPPYGDAWRQRKMRRETLIGWHFIPGVVTFPLCYPFPNSCTGEGQGVRRQYMFSVPDGRWKDCQCHVHNKDEHTTS